MDWGSVLRNVLALELPNSSAEAALLVLASFAVCLGLTLLLPRSWTLETRSRVTSTVHAVVSSTLALRTFFFIMSLPRVVIDPYPSPDNIVAGEAMWLGHVPVARFAVALTLGYIIFDSALGIAFPDLLDLPMIVHHTIVIGACVSGLHHDVGTPYMALLLINEASTPFVNVHFVFKHWKDWRRGVNGLGMWLSYLFCRLIANAAVGFSMFLCTTPRALQTAPALIAAQLAMFLLAQALNTMWFTQITRGLVKQARKMVGGGGGGGKRTASKHATAPAAADATAAAAAAPDAGASSAESDSGAPAAPAAGGVALRQRHA